MSEFTTAREALAAWDQGDILWSVEMGGLGPGYEQAIQVLTFEIVRDYLDKPLPDDASWQTWGDDTAHRINDWPGCGFSGAQVGAAKSLALRFLRDGHKATLDSMRAHDNDRLTQESKGWPHDPAPAAFLGAPE